jgi:phenylacetate-CoA ligase
MSFIQRFGCYAEVFEPYQEKLINQAFPNAMVWSTYSAMEFGMIAGRCPHNSDFHHIFSGKLGVEVLDQSGQPCQKNEVGRLVITDYFNAQSPFIRYEIGDLAAKGDCPCGKIDLPALSFIGGKVRGALVNRAGEKVAFSKLAASLRDLPDIKQNQVIQHEVERFEIRYVTARENESEKRLRDEIIKIVCEYFGYQPIVEFTKEQEIKREANGKFYASICRVDGVECPPKS